MNKEDKMIKYFDAEKCQYKGDFGTGLSMMHIWASAGFESFYEKPPFFNPVNLEKGQVPHHYFFLPILNEGIKPLTVTIDKSPDNQFNHLIQQPVMGAETLSNEKLWLAVARSSSYVMEGLWRGQSNSVVTEFETETEFLTNPDMDGMNANMFYYNKEQGNYQLNLPAMEILSNDERAAGIMLNYVDTKRYRWDKAQLSTNYGMTLGESQGFPHDPKQRINPRTTIGLYTDRVNVPLMENALTHEALMTILNEDGHVCRVMTPVGPVSSYLGKKENGSFFLSTFLENDDFIHSNAKVNEYVVMAIHAAAQFTIQAYAIVQEKGGQVEIGQLNPDFFLAIEGGVDFWNEAKKLTANTLTIGDDPATKVSRYVSEVLAHPYMKLTNEIALDNYREGFVVYQPNMLMDAFYDMSHAQAGVNLFGGAQPKYQQKYNLGNTMELGYEYAYNLSHGNNNDEIISAYQEKKLIYQMTDREASAIFDYNLSSIHQLKKGIGYGFDYKTPVIDDNPLYFLEGRHAYYSIPMHSYHDLQFNSQSKTALIKDDQSIIYDHPSEHIRSQLTIDLDFLKMRKLQSFNNKNESVLKMF